MSARKPDYDGYLPDTRFARPYDLSTVTPDPADACPALHIMHGTCGHDDDRRPLWPAHNYTNPVTGGQLDRCRFCGCTRHQETA